VLDRAAGDSLYPAAVVMEYITEQLLTIAGHEIEQQTLQVLMTHALLKAGAVDYIRDSQRQLILEPLIARLMSHFGSRDAIAHHLRQLLHQMSARDCVIQLLCSRQSIKPPQSSESRFKQESIYQA
jgi:hypothetical protein